MRPGGKSNGESPFFEKPILSFEERVGNVALIPRMVASASIGQRSKTRRMRPTPARARAA